jgi:hypothetical protein
MADIGSNVDPEEWPMEGENEPLDDEVEEKNKRPSFLQGHYTIAAGTRKSEETLPKSRREERSTKSKSHQSGRFHSPQDMFVRPSVYLD